MTGFELKKTLNIPTPSKWKYIATIMHYAMKSEVFIQTLFKG